MGKFPLETIDVKSLDIQANPYDLRRDIHVFVAYMQSHRLKRTHRHNTLSKTEARRIAKILDYPSMLDEIKAEGESMWLNYVDHTARKLGFVSYDTEGQYVGYTSAEPSFPNNYIEFQERPYNRYVVSSLLKQESLLFKTFVEDYSYSHNEFYQGGPLSRLNHFSQFGSAVGIMPMLDFIKTRKFLFDFLAQGEAGVWYSTASLVRYLKRYQPYFLIPKNPVYKYPSRHNKGRYSDFTESEQMWTQGTVIPDDDPDAFERVEGRYIERFLEYIPLHLGYLDLAYDLNQAEKIFPTRDTLKAFRLNNRFLRFMKQDIPNPKVTIQPNFEIYIESEFYPAAIMTELRPLTDPVSNDTVTILKLNRKKITTAIAEDDSLDVTAILEYLAENELPQNILIELKEWGQQSEVFTLYQGFGLWEGKKESFHEEQSPTWKTSSAKKHTVAEISANLRLVRSPEVLFDRLEKAGLIPLLLWHEENKLTPAPDEAETIFIKQSQIVEKSKEKQTLSLKQETIILLNFPDEISLEVCRQAMVDLRCPITVDRGLRQLSYSTQYQSLAEKALQALAEEYQVAIRDMKYTPSG